MLLNFQQQKNSKSSQLYDISKVEEFLIKVKKILTIQKNAQSSEKKETAICSIYEAVAKKCGNSKSIFFLLCSITYNNALVTSMMCVLKKKLEEESIIIQNSIMYYVITFSFLAREF